MKTPKKIDWVKQIPSAWEICKLKYTALGKGQCFIDGDWIESKDISTDGIRYLTSGNVGPLKYKEQGNGYITAIILISHLPPREASR